MRSIDRNEAGNVAAIVALTAFAIAAGAGFAMNMNRMETTADYLQRVADSAAIGAVVVGMNDEKQPADITAAGQALAASMLNGRHAGADVQVELENRTPAQVKVQIKEPVEMIFGGLLAKREQTLTRTATAVSQASEPVCLLVLNPAAPESLRLKGSPEISTRACTVQVNSTASKAVSVGGSASIDATAIYVAGPPSPDGKINPKPQYNQKVLKDPLEDKLPWPSAASCDHTNFSAKKGAQTISPGVYCGGMKFASGADVTLSPGTYVIQTGSLSFSANSQVNGPNGVTVVMLDPAGHFDLQGGPDVNLQSPTSGPWKGIVLAIKPQPTKVTSQLQGGGDLTLGGVVYMPTQKLDMQGGNKLGGLPLARGFVVDTLDMQGSGALTLAGDPRLQGQQRNPRLIH